MMNNCIVYFRKGGDFLKYHWTKWPRKQVAFFHGRTAKVAESNIFTCKPRSILKRLILGVICGDLCKASQPGSHNQALSSLARFYALPLTSLIFQGPRAHTQNFSAPSPPQHLHTLRLFTITTLFQHTVTSLCLHNRISTSTITSLQHLKSPLPPQIIAAERPKGASSNIIRI